MREGDGIEPPYLTSFDVQRIENFTGLKREQFTSAKTNPTTGRINLSLKTIKREQCVFFNHNSGKCEIYSLRPIDCRLFPLDIKMINNNLYWAFFMYDKCVIEIEELNQLIEFGKQSLPFFGDELIDYATFPVPGMEKIGYRILEMIEA